MGAFDSELYRLGYRFFEIKEDATYESSNQDLLNSLFLARAPCIGCCIEKCLNSYCPAHPRFISGEGEK